MSLVTADLGGKNYTLPRGTLYFDRYETGVTIDADTQGEGERYFGNTPGFTVSAAAENLDHFSSEGGVKVKDASVQLSLNRSGKITCDNMNTENLALSFLGTSATLSQSSATGTITLVTGKQGRFYQLGASSTNPSGLRKVSNVVVKKGASFVTTVAASTNYQVDSDLGRLYIEEGAPGIPDDTDLQITFDVAASTRSQVVSGSVAIYGALRLVADNPTGTNLDYYFPYVKIAPDGDLALKSDEWMKADFTLEVLTKADNVAAVYIDGRPS